MLIGRQHFNVVPVGFATGQSIIAWLEKLENIYPSENALRRLVEFRQSYRGRRWHRFHLVESQGFVFERGRICRLWWSWMDWRRTLVSPGRVDRKYWCNDVEEPSKSSVLLFLGRQDPVTEPASNRSLWSNNENQTYWKYDWLSGQRRRRQYNANEQSVSWRGGGQDWIAPSTMVGLLHVIPDVVQVM